MPPKAEKKAKATPTETKIGEYNIPSMTVPELQGFVHRLQHQVEKTRKALNFCSSEKDRAERFWQICRGELEEQKAQIVLARKEIEDASRKYEEKKTQNLQKLKYIEHERQRKMVALKQMSLQIYSEAREKLASEKSQNLGELNLQQRQLRALQAHYERKIQEMNEERCGFLKEGISSREKKIGQTIEAYERMYDELEASLRLLKDVATHEFEEQKRGEYRAYVRSHANSVRETKEYFKGIIGGSLALIDVLKSEISRLEAVGRATENTRKKIAEENESLQHVTKEGRSYRIQLAHFEQDKKSNAFTLERILEYSQKIGELQAQHLALSDEFDGASKEKEDFKVNFVSRLREVEELLRAKNALIERKIRDLLQQLQQIGVPTESLNLEVVDYAECYHMDR